ncbi:MAG: hypothetical protein J6V17_01990 [Bacteroidales bacterium]|nr:hypothetical protein [Bacteroidales bacterium]
MRYFLLRMKRFCGFITGFVFFIGGILKLMDPVGAGLVMGEYLDFLHLNFLGFAAKPLGVAFALAETLIGTALITGVWRKIVGIAALGFQTFFTILTLALVIFNPEMDCGCFGEAIHLTHWETFLKNIALLTLLSAYFFPTKMLGQPMKGKFVSFGIVTASVLIFTVYSWIYIPLVDFTDYKPAATLKAGQVYAEADSDAYEAMFVYEKDGVEESFDLENLPDSTWAFVRTETVEKKVSGNEGLVDLSFYNIDGEYLDSMAAKGKVMVVSVYDPEISDKKWMEISDFILNAEEAGFDALLLVAGTQDQVVHLDFIENVYFADYKTLIAMNRSNGGVTYFNDGYLVRKWAYRALPNVEKLQEIYNDDVTETIIYHDTKGSLGFQGFLLYVFAVMLLL